jgi:pimeloyl-ACP methyl ester carboxylesterase
MNVQAHDVRFREARLRSGLRLRYAERGPAEGEPILFLHGYTDSSLSFSQILPRLPARFRALALDQRGHGDSERPAGGYRMADFAADAVGFLDALGLARTTLVGHCMGGFVAQCVAIEHPERVERLVLAASYTTAANDVVRELAREIAALADPVPRDFVRAFQASTAYGPLPEGFLEAVVAESLKLPARVWQAVMDGVREVSSRDRLHLVRAPTAILWGDRDAVFPFEEQERLRASIAGAALHVLPETGHALHWEQPERFVRELGAFISR